MSRTVTVHQTGYSLFFLVFVILLVLKLVGLTPELSWWIVFLPLCIPFLLFVGFLVVAAIIFVIAAIAMALSK